MPVAVSGDWLKKWYRAMLLINRLRVEHLRTLKIVDQAGTGFWQNQIKSPISRRY